MYCLSVPTTRQTQTARAAQMSRAPAQPAVSPLPAPDPQLPAQALVRPPSLTQDQAPVLLTQDQAPVLPPALEQAQAVTVQKEQVTHAAPRPDLTAAKAAVTSHCKLHPHITQ